MCGRAARDLDIAKRDPFSRNKFLGGDISIFEKIAVVGGAEIGDGEWWGRRPGTGTSIGHGGAAWGGERGGGNMVPAQRAGCSRSTNILLGYKYDFLIIQYAVQPFSSGQLTKGFFFFFLFLFFPFPSLSFLLIDRPLFPPGIF